MPRTTHPLAWFEKRQGQTIQRNGRAFTIPEDNEAVSYCLELQESGYSFDDAPKPKVHASPMVCTSCEG
jgi:hypothetical protein